MDYVFDIVGLVGVACVVCAFFLQQKGKWTTDHVRYHVVNFVGALCVIISLTHQWNLPQFVLEAVWGVLSLVGLWRLKRRQNGAG